MKNKINKLELAFSIAKPDLIGGKAAPLYKNSHFWTKA